MKNQKSIVVLPFKNISSDSENEYFADGITEEIINALSRIEGLKVTARTSSFAYKNNPKDIRFIGKELGVGVALEGSIRKAGDQIRISTQLIKTENGFQIWSESFNRNLTDIFELQDEISLLIADKIRENFGHLEIKEHLVTAWTHNVEAYTLYLRGRYFQLRWNVEDFYKATIEYEKSIKLDPLFFQPYYGMVQCYGLMASWGFANREESLKKAKHYLSEGLKLNDQTPEAHFALATRSLWIEWKPYQALRHLDCALAINLNDSETLESAAEAHIALGQYSDAYTSIRKALEVNPLSANHHFTLGNIYYLQEEYTLALQSFKRSLEIDPTWDFSLQVSACCHVFLGNRSALETLLNDHKGMTGGYLFYHLYDAVQHGKYIDTDALSEMNDIYLPWSLWVLIYANKKDEAIERLRKGIKNKQGQYLNFQREPLNAPLRLSDEYRSLVESVFDEPEIKTEQIKQVGPQDLLSLEDQKLYVKKLKELMTNDLMYLDDSLTLRTLANAIELNANKLSWLINQVIGKNFNEYINGFRLEAFKRKALDPNFSQYSLLGIAHECGFRSKSVFNDYFKRSEGITPSGWVKQRTNS